MALFLIFSLCWWMAPTVALAERIEVQLTSPSEPLELRVEILWGTIEVAGEEGLRTLTIETFGDRPGEVGTARIEVNENANVVSIRQDSLRPGVMRSANLRIRTPFRTSVDLRIERGGDIEVSRLEGLAEITNLNGSVDLERLSGAAAVNASNGAIQAHFTAVEAGRDMIFTSLNGSVELCLPPSYSGHLHLSTAGDPIFVTLPWHRDPSTRTVEPDGELDLERVEVRGRVGSGGADLRASTLNGEIRLETCESHRPEA
ncbi:MAG: hypothetical protein AAF481_17160 [Acidobacteriota bacterium]